MSIALSVNLNKIALIRNSREGDFPRLLDYAEHCVNAGVQGITLHPRPDQRHVRPEDVRTIATLLKSHPSLELNIEGNPFASPRGSYPGLIELVEEVRPHQCTLVPDSDDQATSDHGFDLHQSAETLTPLIERIHATGTRVSLFMDPDIQQIHRVSQLGAECIELYTGPFAWAYQRDPAEGQKIFTQHCKAAEFALGQGLKINAGHDLNLQNMALYKTLPGLREVSIGHALTVDALNMGFGKALEAYLTLCR